MSKTSVWMDGYFQGKASAYELASKWVREDCQTKEGADLANYLMALAKDQVKSTKERNDVLLATESDRRA